MVLVPAGPFIMGNNNDFYDNDNDEKPQHTVDLPAFFVDRYPVTNQDYQAFMAATGHAPPRYWPASGGMPPGKADHPVVGVTFADATAYAHWKGRRLLTEEEWEKTARGTAGLRWPWGSVFDERKANVGTDTTTPVHAHPDGASPYGVFEMAGNVWEWTDTWYELYPGSPPNRTVQRFTGGKVKVVRGGSYSSDIGSARGADRGNKKIDEPGPSLGFRTAQDVPGYESYAAALKARSAAREAQAAAALDITEYAEHEPARALAAGAARTLQQADGAFDGRDFAASERQAGEARTQFDAAREKALDYKRQVMAKKAADTEEQLVRLETALKAVPDGLSPEQQALKTDAEDNLRRGREFFDEGGWGFAGMHAFIGLRQLENLRKLAGP